MDMTTLPRSETGTTLEESVRKHLKYNITVNLLDGAFFGLGWGFGSMGTILPLLVSRMTARLSKSG